MTAKSKTLLIVASILLISQSGLLLAQDTSNGTSASSTSTLNSLFTLESLLSLQGAAAASILVPNTLSFLIGPRFDRFRLWVSFLIALGLAILTAALATDTNAIKWVLAVINGFLIFSSAVGVNQGASAATAPQRRDRSAGGKIFFTSWF